MLLALVVYASCAVFATWPAIRHVDGHYLARPAAGYGEAAAGDHLQLGWSFWLVGHQLGGIDSPLADPYSFRPEAEAAPNLQGWLLGLPYWPLGAAFGDVWAYDLVVLLSFVLAGLLACWWLRTLDVSRPAALVGGAVFCLMPYRVGQSTGHLLGLISFLLPAVLLALERRRFVLAGVALAAIPLSGQLHLALGAIPLALGYAWARVPRADWWKAGAGAAAAIVAGLVVERWAVSGSIGTGRSFAQVERYSAELTDFITRRVGSGVEELVFVGWLTPALALAGLVAVRHRRGLVVLLGVAAVIPCLLALGANLPGYETLWRTAPGLDSTLPMGSTSLRKELQATLAAGPAAAAAKLAAARAADPNPSSTAPMGSAAIKMAAEASPPPAGKGPLEGTWKLTSVEINAQPLAMEKLGEARLTVQDPKYSLILGDTRLEMSHVLFADKQPKAMDLTVAEGADRGQVFAAIYKLDGDTLTVCRNIKPGVDRPAEFGTKPDTGLMLVVWERHKSE